MPRETAHRWTRWTTKAHLQPTVLQHEQMESLQAAPQVEASHRNVYEPSADEALYLTDDFRMWCLKVIPCTRRYVHDWSVCPFAHAGEKAVRRDPRTHEYTGIACPEMKKAGSCLRGDACPYAHNVFEYWLHPTRYRTQLCNDGPACKRSICFFAHSLSELRTPAVKPYVSPEALARASLQAIHQNPHPLGAQLPGPFKQGGMAAGSSGSPGGSMGGMGALGPVVGRGFAPHTPRQQGLGGYVAPGPQQGGLWRERFSSSGRSLRSSADYGRMSLDSAGGYGGHGTGLGQPPAAGAPVPAPGMWLGEGSSGSRGGAGWVPPHLLSPAPALSWAPEAPYQPGPGASGQRGHGLPLALPGGCLHPMDTAAGRLSTGSELGAGAPESPAVQAAWLNALLAGRLSNSSMDSSTEALMGDLLASTGMDAATVGALAGRLSTGSVGGLSDVTMALTAQGSTNTALGEALEAALAGRLSSNSMDPALGPATVGPYFPAGAGAGAGAESAVAAGAGAGAAPQVVRGSGSSGEEVEEGLHGSLEDLPPGIPVGADDAAGPATPALPAEPSHAAATHDPAARRSSADAGEEGLAQSLANMKIARTQQQVAASAGSNHDIVISTLHQILKDAVQAQQGVSGGAPSMPSHA